MRNPPRTVQEAFKLADDVQLQLEVVDNFKLQLSNNFSLVDVNEMSAEETSGNEYEVNEMSRGKKWGNNSNYKDIIPIAIIIAGPSTTNLNIIKQVRPGNKRERTTRSP